MSRAQEPHRPFPSFGNPFRMISPKGSHLSSVLVAQLNTFEETLAGRIEKLKPACMDDFLSLSWMRCAIESLCGIHNDVQALITALELPVRDWEDKWVDVYFDDSVKLLDISIAFSSQISRLKQGNLFLHCGLSSNLDVTSSKQLVEARQSLDEWRQHIALKNPRLEDCFCVMDGFAQKLDLPKIKNSAKGKVLMRAMYGVKVVTLLVCRIFAATFAGSAKKPMDLEVSGTFMWGGAFADLQTFVNAGIRSIYLSGRVMILKELEAVDTGVQKLYPILQDGVAPVEAKVLQDLTSDLGESRETLSQGLDLLAKEVDMFFKIVFTGRDALLSKLRVGGNVSNPVRANKKVGGHRVVS